MSPAGEILVGLTLIAGLLGTVLFVFPGLLIQVAALFIWAVVDGDPIAWTVAIVALLIAGAATLVKYLIPGRRLKRAGVPMLVLAPATILAIVGFFMIPVLGAPLFFVASIYLIELFRVGSSEAWPATKASLGAVAMSVGIEFSAALLILGVWVVAVLLT